MYTHWLSLFLKQQKRGAQRERSARFSLMVQGRCVKLSYRSQLRRNALTADSLQLRSRRVKRGKVTYFSRRSRRRLMELFHRLHYDTAQVTAFFITLTYEDMQMLRPVWKDDVKLFLRRLERYFKREYGVAAVSAIWRLELQERGVPHWHIVLFVPLPELWLTFKLVSDYWGETVGLAFNGFPPRVDVQQVRSFERLAFYVSKYVAKVDDALSLSKGSYSDGFGRWWGVYRRARLPYARRYMLSVPYPVWLDARRLVKRLVVARAGRGLLRQYRRGVPQGCTYYSRDALGFVRFAMRYGYRRPKRCLYRVVW